MGKRRASLTVMIKPASAACNLACDYCFYLDTAAHRKEGTWPAMSDDVVQATIHKSLDEAQAVSFVFQGGEPSLAGLSFFERFVSEVTAYKKPEQTIHYAFQTNGLSLDKEWASFFKEHEFLVGISFDGNPKIHDIHRFDRKGEGSGRRVAKAISLANEEGVAFNTLSVVTNTTADNTERVWRWLVDQNITYHQYIACIDPLEGEYNFLSPASYGRFLKESFDLYYRSFMSDAWISVRFFDNLVGMLLGMAPESCDMAGVCSANYVVESNGNIYPCDFYCFDDQLLGNILTDSYADLDEKRSKLRFIEDSPNRIDGCESCQWQPLCRGGCKRYRSSEGYKYCSSMKEFFPYAIKRLNQMASILEQGRQ
ncbi:MAG: SPASM domain-containing protein [Spirochaetales bacterium]|nr:SPASM domain-containing protein [Spirochaetales bacterium]